MQLNDKTIWITGASSGIGRELAIQLSAKGCNLILSARRKEALEETRQRCKNQGNIKILPLDLADTSEMDSLTTKAINFFGKVDILINNGGLSQRSLIIDTKLSVYERLMKVNYLGTVGLSKALLPSFISQKHGHYVVVTSLMGKFSSPMRSGYCGAKHALHGFFDGLRLEHEKDGVKVTIVCPGFVNTDVARNAVTGDGSKQNEQDTATESGMDVSVFAKKMIRAIEKEKMEVYIGGKETMGVYLKRFFPKLLHRVVGKSNVT